MMRHPCTTAILLAAMILFSGACSSDRETGSEEAAPEHARPSPSTRPAPIATAVPPSPKKPTPAPGAHATPPQEPRPEPVTTPSPQPAPPPILPGVAQGRWYAGQEQGATAPWPFRIRFTSFDVSTGRLAGEMEYVSQDDRALLRFEGTAKNERLAFAHTRAVRQGRSAPSYEYEMERSKDGRRITGTYRKMGSAEQGCEVWFSLEQEGDHD